MCQSFCVAQDVSDQTFADYLFREGEYYRAITEYYRMLQVESDHQNRAFLLRKIGNCYFQGEDYEGYLVFINKNMNDLCSDTLLCAEMNLYRGKSYYYLDRFQEAIHTLDSQQLKPSNPFFNDAQFLMAISYSRNDDWTNAVEELQRIKRRNSEVDGIRAENIIRSFQNYQKKSTKSPFLAGGLSAVIPGSGYAYCQHWGTAIASLFVNGLLVWTFADALRQEQYGLASLTGFVGIGWYGGNIWGSARAARRYNAHLRDDYINSILMRENLLEYLKD